MVGRGGRVAGAEEIMIVGGGVRIGMAARTAEIFAVGPHVHVQFPGRIGHGRVKVSVFHGITTTTVEMAGATCLPACQTGVSSDQSQVQAGHWSAGALGLLHIGAGRVVAYQAVHLGLVGKIEGVVSPADSHVATGAAWFVGSGGDTEVVDDVLLAKHLAAGRIDVVPSPVAGCHQVVVLPAALPVTHKCLD